MLELLRRAARRGRPRRPRAGDGAVHRAPERVQPPEARRRRGRPPAVPRARDRVRAVLPARERAPHREVPTRPAPGRGARLAGRQIDPSASSGWRRSPASPTDRGHTLLDLAISALASTPGIAGVIAGATTPEQVRANAAAGRWHLSDDQLAALAASTGASSRALIAISSGSVHLGAMPSRLGEEQR